MFYRLDVRLYINIPLLGAIRLSELIKLLIQSLFVWSRMPSIKLFGLPFQKENLLVEFKGLYNNLQIFICKKLEILKHPDEKKRDKMNIMKIKTWLLTKNL